MFGKIGKILTTTTTMMKKKFLDKRPGIDGRNTYRETERARNKFF